MNRTREATTTRRFDVIADREAARPMRRQLMEKVNAEVRALARRVDQSGDWRWPFVCECGDEPCDEPVLLSLQLYDDLRREGVTLLADGHPAGSIRAAEARVAAQ